MSDYFSSKLHFYNVVQKSEKQLLVKIGLNVKRLRLDKNLSQFQLSTEAEIPKNQIGRIERAEINTTILTLNKIANVLNVDIKELLL